MGAILGIPKNFQVSIHPFLNNEYSTTMANVKKATKLPTRIFGTLGNFTK
jgi:hypothetical protein